MYRKDGIIVYRILFENGTWSTRYLTTCTISNGRCSVTVVDRDPCYTRLSDIPWTDRCPPCRPPCADHIAKYWMTLTLTLPWTGRCPPCRPPCAARRRPWRSIGWPWPYLGLIDALRVALLVLPGGDHSEVLDDLDLTLDWSMPSVSPSLCCPAATMAKYWMTLTLTLPWTGRCPPCRPPCAARRRPWRSIGWPSWCSQFFRLRTRLWKWNAQF